MYACVYQCVKGGTRERISKTSTLRLERTKKTTTEHRQVDRLATGDTTQAKMAQPLLLGLSAASGIGAVGVYWGGGSGTELHSEL